MRKQVEVLHIPYLPVLSNSYVYTIAYSDGTVFYVGIGTVEQGAGDRIKQHLYMARGNQKLMTRVAQVIHDVWEQGNRIIIRKPYNYIPYAEALRLEKELIERYGYEQLVNHPWSRHPHLCSNWKQRIENRAEVQRQKMIAKDGAIIV